MKKQEFPCNIFPLSISISGRLFKFQFHHTQMDGVHAAKFLDAVQKEIKALGKPYQRPFC
ncbi:MAG: hypothetical protein IK117_10530 [Bacteroidales bacterium]|nr:hypothetical protein [Bacteroidales bacterium]